MALNTARITGRVPLSDDSIPDIAAVRFTLTGFDTEAGDDATIPPFPIDAAIDNSTGEIDVNLWRNAVGVRETQYKVSVVITRRFAPDLALPLGNITIPSTGSYDLNDLLPIDPSTPANPTVQELIDAVEADVAELTSRVDALAVASGTGFPYYASTAAGIADTDNGDVFSVSEGDALSLYQNVSDVATLLGRLSYAAPGPKHFGAVGNGVADDTAAFTSWISYLDAQKVPGHIPDGTYLVTYVINRALNNSLRITASPNAVIKGTLTLEEFGGDDTTTSFEVTDFTFGPGGIRAAIVSGGVATQIDEGIDFTVAGQTLDLSAGSSPYGDVATGDTLRVVSADPVMEFGPDTEYGATFTMEGGTIDNSQRGFVPTTASGSGLLLVNFDRYTIDGVTFDGGEDYEQNQANGYADSGLTTNNCNQGVVTNSTFIAQSDLGYYLTGGADPGASDNTITHSVFGNWFLKCFTGGKAERQVFAHSVYGNTFDQCRNGWLVAGVASGSLGGGRAHIYSNTFYRSGRRSIDVRRSFDVNIYDNHIIDPGYELDGETAEVGNWSIDVAGTRVGMVHNNIIEMKDLTRANQTGMRIREDTEGDTLQSDRIHVHNNYMEGLNVGIDENDTGTGNIYRENDIRNTTTEISVPSGRRWHYRRSNVEYEGIGSTLFKDEWTPEFSFNGGSITLSSESVFGIYERTGDIVRAWFRCQATITHSETTAELQIENLPFTAYDSPNIDGGGSLTLVSRVGLPSGAVHLVPVVVNNTTNIQLQGMSYGAGTASSGRVTAAQVTSGNIVRVDGFICYAVEPEAQN